MKSENAFLLADGDRLPRSVRDRLRRGRYTVAIDGATELARKEGWRPDLISGDFDTVSARTLRYFGKAGVELLPTPDQDYTDLEKALAWCALRKFKSVWVAQALGQRLDHTLANLALLSRFHSPERELLFFTDTERLRFARDETIERKGRRGRRVAVIPFPRCRVSSQGLAYEMQDLELRTGERESVSNRARATDVKLRIEGEALVIEEYRPK